MAISTAETITATVPATALVTSSSALVATPTFQVTPVVTAVLTGTLADDATEDQIVAGGETLIITLDADTWDATVGADNAITTALINGLDGDGTEWDTEVKANMDFNDVVRTSDTVVTITLGAEAGYDISTAETITATVPASALVTSSSAVVATPTFQVTPVFPPLTSVSNSPSPNTVSDSSTHTVAFTTADALPADGKIVVTPHPRLYCPSSMS